MVLTAPIHLASSHCCSKPHLLSVFGDDPSSTVMRGLRVVFDALVAEITRRRPVIQGQAGA